MFEHDTPELQWNLMWNSSFIYKSSPKYAFLYHPPMVLSVTPFEHSEIVFRIFSEVFLLIEVILDEREHSFPRKKINSSSVWIILPRIVLWWVLTWVGKQVLPRSTSACMPWSVSPATWMGALSTMTMSPELTSPVATIFDCIFGCFSLRTLFFNDNFR